MKHLIWLTIFLSLNAESKVYQLLEHKLYQSNVVTKELENNSLNVKFTIPSFEAIDDKSYGIVQENFSTISVDGLENTKEVSKVSLPFFSFIIKGVPGDFKVKLKKGQGYFMNDLLPSPARELPCRCAKDKNLNPNIDLKIYEEGRGLYSVEYLGDFRGVALSKVIVSPMKFRNQRFEVYPELELILTNKNGKSLEFDADKVVNQKMANKNYLMVAASHLVEATNELAAYKRSQGFKVKVVDLAVVGKTSDKLKAFLHEEYKRNEYSYALLIGHEESMPTEYVSTSSEAQTPSDLKYFTMGQGTDLIPDVFYGRIVADQASEVLAQLKKIKEYDSKSYAQTSGKDRFVGIASDEGSNPTDVEYMKGFAKEFQDAFTIKTSFFFQENSDSNSRNIVSSLNKGANWLSYIGHGSGTSWSSVNRGDFNSGNIKELSSAAVKPVVIDVACQNGRFSYEGRLGERFMNESKSGQPIGAVAYYGGSVDISWHPPAVMARGINKAIATEGVKGLGEALLKGQLYLLAQYDDRNAAEENLVWYHLFGDPSMVLSFN